MSSLRLFDCVDDSQKIIEFLLSDASEAEKGVAIGNIKNLKKAKAVLMGIVFNQESSHKEQKAPKVPAIPSRFPLDTTAEVLFAKERRFPLPLFEDAARIRLYSKASFDPEKKEGRYGIIADVYGDNDEPLHRDMWAQGFSGTTENRMELLGVIDALSQVRADFGAKVKVEVICSSEYIVKAMNQWAPVWADNGWKKKNGKSIQNAELIKWLYNFRNPEVTFIFGNEDPLFEECLKISSNI